MAMFCAWLYGGQKIFPMTGGGRSRIHPEYFKGLSYIINEQPDKAIEIFIKMLEVDSETIEVHFALGNLFRSRGEVDRAIRIHQNLVTKPSIGREQRAMALFELGIDYTRSGLLDRAENLFTELVETGLHKTAASIELLDIYQQEQDWVKAIQVARKLQRLGTPQEEKIAQFYCEQANELWAQGKGKEAKECLHKATRIDPNCVRANLIEASILIAEEKIEAALHAYKLVERQDPEYISETIEPMYRCYKSLGKLDEFKDYLQKLVNHRSVAPMLMLVELVAEQEGEKAAMQMITAELEQQPTVQGISRLIEYALIPARGEIRDNLVLINQLVNKLLQSQPAYKCNYCGFHAKTLYWLCPGCKKWNTVRPIQAADDQ